MKRYVIVYQGAALHRQTVVASDLPAAVQGFYAMRGPASGGTLLPGDIVSAAQLVGDADG